jgi:hypothetical protein
MLDSKRNPDFGKYDSIDNLDIADGLKELLRTNKLTLHTLVTISPSELADILGIDGYVAKIVCESAKKKISFDSNDLVYDQG